MAWRGLVVALGLWGGAVHAREGLDVALSRHETELVEVHERRPTLATRQALIEAGQSRSDACDAAYEAGDREASRALRGALLVPRPRPRARGLSRTEAGSGALGPAARALFDAVLRPLWAELDGAGHILVAADGRLNLVPFDVLLAAGEQDADQVQISYLTSGRDLLRIDGGGSARSTRRGL